MLFRLALAPLFAISALLCAALGAIVIGSHFYAVSTHQPQLQPQISPLDGALFLFSGMFLALMAVLFFEIRSFRRLSTTLRQYSHGVVNAAIRRIPIPSWAPGEIRGQPEPLKIGVANKPFVFLSYSHMDDQWRASVTTWLSPNLKSHGWDLWTDKRIAPGYKWTSNLSWAVENSSIAICLVSQDFIASEFIVIEELPALRRRSQNELYGIDWIPISIATVSAVKLDENQALWPSTEPLDDLLPGDQRKALKRIADNILKKILQVEQLAPDPPKPKGPAKCE